MVAQDQFVRSGSASAKQADLTPIDIGGLELSSTRTVKVGLCFMLLCLMVMTRLAFSVPRVYCTKDILLFNMLLSVSLL